MTFAPPLSLLLDAALWDEAVCIECGATTPSESIACECEECGSTALHASTLLTLRADWLEREGEEG